MSDKLPRVPANRIITLLKKRDLPVYVRVGVIKFSKILRVSG